MISDFLSWLSEYEDMEAKECGIATIGGAKRKLDELYHTRSALAWTDQWVQKMIKSFLTKLCGWMRPLLTKLGFVL